MMNKIIDKLREKSIDFEQWLQEKYVEIEHPLDDMIPDGFNDWLEGLDIADVLDYGTRFASLVADSIITDLTKQGEPIGEVIDGDIDKDGTYLIVKVRESYEADVSSCVSPEIGTKVYTAPQSPQGVDFGSLYDEVNSYYDIKCGFNLDKDKFIEIGNKYLSPAPNTELLRECRDYIARKRHKPNCLKHKDNYHKNKQFVCHCEPERTLLNRIDNELTHPEYQQGGKLTTNPLTEPTIPPNQEEIDELGESLKKLKDRLDNELGGNQ